MASKIIAQGAEAILTRKGNQIVKKRVKKGYRLPIIDNRIRKQRTKKEARLLEKASKLIPIPKILKVDENTHEITLEFLNGKKLSENLDKLKNNLQICKTLGKQIAKLHDNGIIHGDLTTSNMIYVPYNKHTKNKIKSNGDLLINNKTNICLDKPSALGDNKSSGKLYFIDFGLGYESTKPEDKAVDLHLIKQALEAKHFKHYEKYWKAILAGYRTSANSKIVLNRLEKVEGRGRYKQAY